MNRFRLAAPACTCHGSLVDAMPPEHAAWMDALPAAMPVGSDETNEVREDFAADYSAGLLGFVGAIVRHPGVAASVAMTFSRVTNSPSINGGS